MTDTSDDTDAPVFLNIEAVKALVGGASTSTIYADPTFPLPVILSRKKVRWVRDEVVAWMREKIAQRDANAENRRRELEQRRERRRNRQRLKKPASPTQPSHP